MVIDSLAASEVDCGLPTYDANHVHIYTYCSIFIIYFLHYALGTGLALATMYSVHPHESVEHVRLASHLTYQIIYSIRGPRRAAALIGRAFGTATPADDAPTSQIACSRLLFSFFASLGDQRLAGLRFETPSLLRCAAPF
jgi:hypothetical protein